jgi:hypothetical protein
MGYQITAHEPVAERRDHPHSLINTRRTFATRRTKSDAIETARALLDAHADVTIWNDRPGAGQIIENWIPPKTVILSGPRWVGTAPAVMSWFTRSVVDRHFYEYTAGDGRKVNFAFETHCNEAPQVPTFGTLTAIERFRCQWQCWNCQGRGYAGDDRWSKDRESCHACGGGERHRQAAAA